MKKIVLIPLDERPCNYDFPGLLAKETEYQVVVPPMNIMGHKKQVGNIEGIWKWLFEETKDADGVIISIDTLLYSGIVPSRLHYDTAEELISKLEQLKKLKEANPKLKMYGFNLIMRNPKYSSSDEEPDYYEDWGSEIHRYGHINHKIELGIASEEEIKELEDVNARLPKEYLVDYIERRKVNIEVNKRAIKLVDEGVLDFMIIPQDDSSPYGLTAKDQILVRDYIDELNVGLSVYMYPDADAVANTLLARMINEDKEVKPLMYVRYNSSKAPHIIPAYEDRLLSESIKYQIIAAGGLVASSVNEADIVLMVNAPADNMLDLHVRHSKVNKKTIEYDAFRNIIESIEYANYVINTLNKPCIFADVAYANGGDVQLLKLLSKKGLLYKLAGYAGWNTSSNSLGTCIPQGMIFDIYNNTKAHKDFLALRYTEDVGHCYHARSVITLEHLPEMGYDYYEVDGPRGEVSKLEKKELEKFVKEYVIDDKYDIEILDCWLPWNRMFEVGLDVQVVEK